MSNIYKEKTSCNIANEDGAPDVLYVGEAVELRVNMPNHKLKEGQRGIADKIYKGRIRFSPFGDPAKYTVQTSHVFKLNLGA